MEEKYYYVYISTNKLHKVLYTGVTNNIFNRDDQHKNKINKESFAAKYNINKIVYYETFININEAIAREKQIKGGSKKKKLELIRSMNPGWRDLVNNSEKSTFA